MKWKARAGDAVVEGTAEQIQSFVDEHKGAEVSVSAQDSGVDLNDLAKRVADKVSDWDMYVAGMVTPATISASARWLAREEAHGSVLSWISHPEYIWVMAIELHSDRVVAAVNYRNDYHEIVVAI